MMSFNFASTPGEVNMKLVTNENEELVYPTLLKQIVGSLRYLCNSKPDIVYVVDIISRFMSEPRSSHMFAAKRVMRCIMRALDYGILFHVNVNEAAVNLTTYSDVDWCGDKQARKALMDTYLRKNISF